MDSFSSQCVVGMDGRWIVSNPLTSTTLQEGDEVVVNVIGIDGSTFETSTVVGPPKKLWERESSSGLRWGMQGQKVPAVMPQLCVNAVGEGEHELSGWSSAQPGSLVYLNVRPSVLSSDETVARPGRSISQHRVNDSAVDTPTMSDWSTMEEGPVLDSPMDFRMIVDYDNSSDPNFNINSMYIGNDEHDEQHQQQEEGQPYPPPPPQQQQQQEESPALTLELLMANLTDNLMLQLEQSSSSSCGLSFDVSVPESMMTGSAHPTKSPSRSTNKSKSNLRGSLLSYPLLPPKCPNIKCGASWEGLEPKFGRLRWSLTCRGKNGLRCPTHGWGKCQWDGCNYWGAQNGQQRVADIHEINCPFNPRPNLSIAAAAEKKMARSKKESKKPRLGFTAPCMRAECMQQGVQAAVFIAKGQHRKGEDSANYVHITHCLDIIPRYSVLCGCGKKKHLCPFCGKQFDDMRGMMARHLIQDIGQFACEYPWSAQHPPSSSSALSTSSLQQHIGDVWVMATGIQQSQQNQGTLVANLVSIGSQERWSHIRLGRSFMHPSTGPALFPQYNITNIIREITPPETASSWQSPIQFRPFSNHSGTQVSVECTDDAFRHPAMVFVSGYVQQIEFSRRLVPIAMNPPNCGDVILTGTVDSVDGIQVHVYVDDQHVASGASYQGQWSIALPRPLSAQSKVEARVAPEMLTDPEIMRKHGLALEKKMESIVANLRQLMAQQLHQHPQAVSDLEQVRLVHYTHSPVGITLCFMVPHFSSYPSAAVAQVFQEGLSVAMMDTSSDAEGEDEEEDEEEDEDEESEHESTDSVCWNVDEASRPFLKVLGASDEVAEDLANNVVFSLQSQNQENLDVIRLENTPLLSDDDAVLDIEICGYFPKLLERSTAGVYTAVHEFEQSWRDWAAHTESVQFVCYKTSNGSVTLRLSAPFPATVALPHSRIQAERIELCEPRVDRRNIEQFERFHQGSSFVTPQPEHEEEEEEEEEEAVARHVVHDGLQNQFHDRRAALKTLSLLPRKWRRDVNYLRLMVVLATAVGDAESAKKHQGYLGKQLSSHSQSVSTSSVAADQAMTKMLLFLNEKNKNHHAAGWAIGSLSETANVSSSVILEELQRLSSSKVQLGGFCEATELQMDNLVAMALVQLIRVRIGEWDGCLTLDDGSQSECANTEEDDEEDTNGSTTSSTTRRREQEELLHSLRTSVVAASQAAAAASSSSADSSSNEQSMPSSLTTSSMYDTKQANKDLAAHILLELENAETARMESSVPVVSTSNTQPSCSPPFIFKTNLGVETGRFPEGNNNTHVVVESQLQARTSEEHQWHNNNGDDGGNDDEEEDPWALDDSRCSQSNNNNNSRNDHVRTGESESDSDSKLLQRWRATSSVRRCRSRRRGSNGSSGSATHLTNPSSTVTSQYHNIDDSSSYSENLNDGEQQQQHQQPYAKYSIPYKDLGSVQLTPINNSNGNMMSPMARSKHLSNPLPSSSFLDVTGTTHTPINNSCPYTTKLDARKDERISRIDLSSYHSRYAVGKPSSPSVATAPLTIKGFPMKATSVPTTIPIGTVSSYYQPSSSAIGIREQGEIIPTKFDFAPLSFSKAPSKSKWESSSSSNNNNNNMLSSAKSEETNGSIPPNNYRHLNTNPFGRIPHHHTPNRGFKGVAINICIFVVRLLLFSSLLYWPLPKWNNNTLWQKISCSFRRSLWIVWSLARLLIFINILCCIVMQYFVIKSGASAYEPAIVAMLCLSYIIAQFCFGFPVVNLTLKQLCHNVASAFQYSSTPTFFPRDIESASGIETMALLPSSSNNSKLVVTLNALHRGDTQFTTSDIRHCGKDPALSRDYVEFWLSKLTDNIRSFDGTLYANWKFAMFCVPQILLFPWILKSSWSLAQMIARLNGNLPISHNPFIHFLRADVHVEILVLVCVGAIAAMSMLLFLLSRALSSEFSWWMGEKLRSDTTEEARLLKLWCEQHCLLVKQRNNIVVAWFLSLILGACTLMAIQTHSELVHKGALFSSPSTAWLLLSFVYLSTWISLLAWREAWESFLDELQAALCDIRNDLVPIHSNPNSEYLVTDRQPFMASIWTEDKSFIMLALDTTLSRMRPLFGFQCTSWFPIDSTLFARCTMICFFLWINLTISRLAMNP